MKRIAIITVMAAVINSGLAYSDEPSQIPEPLRPFRPMIGTWRYEGPILEDVPGVAEKGTNFVIQFSWRWILDRQAVMEDVRFELEGAEPFSAKSLVGWNAAEKRIVNGAVDSAGGVGLGNVVLNPEAKTSTLTLEGVNREGEKTLLKAVVKVTGKDTMTWQHLQRSGFRVEGKGPVYTLKRVAPAKGKKAAK